MTNCQSWGREFVRDRSTARFCSHAGRVSTVTEALNAAVPCLQYHLATLVYVRGRRLRPRRWNRSPWQRSNGGRV
jgi:hypothetical protein